MKKYLLISLLLLFPGIVLSAGDGNLNAGMVNPGFYEKPDWFKDSFLELESDLEEANENNRQIILYFHQDGCPYCKKLLELNFKQKEIIEKMERHFDLIGINMWGDKTVTLLSGGEVSEKEFAKQMKVMFTPTLVILDAKGQSQLRMNGYYAPVKFSAALDSVINKSDIKYAKTVPIENKLKEQFIESDNDLKRLIKNSNKLVMMLFEQGNCVECNELHGDIFRRLPVYQQLQKFTIAQVDINSEERITAPDGRVMPQKEFAESLNIQYTPSILFYEPGGQKEIFRSEAYLKSFHVQALLDYFVSKSYLTESEFQRFVQRRADTMRENGVEVELWE